MAQSINIKTHSKNHYLKVRNRARNQIRQRRNIVTIITVMDMTTMDMIIMGMTMVRKAKIVMPVWECRPSSSMLSPI